MPAAPASPPAAISGFLAELLEGTPRSALRERAIRLSQGYRGRAGSRETILDESDALAYAVARLPATYAATASALRRLQDEVGEFAPKSVLDVGCGLGSGAAAALEVWRDVVSVTLLDRNPPFLALAARLAAASARSAMTEARIVEADFAALPTGLARADLVLAGYALTEIDDEAAPAVLDALWRLCSGALVIVEPGTPRDFSRLLRLRAQLIGSGAHVALPCPHLRACPLAAPDWCHFSVRLPRSRDHKTLKGAEAPFEDEKFSYLVALRRPAPTGGARLIAPPRQFKWGLGLRLCTQAGVGETNISRRDKANFKMMRSSVWGDSLRIEET